MAGVGGVDAVGFGGDGDGGFGRGGGGVFGDLVVVGGWFEAGDCGFVDVLWG